MTFQTPVVPALAPISFLPTPDTAVAILSMAEALQPDLAQGFQIDALRLRLEMEHAFGGPDATGAWDWKLAYDACEVTLALLLRKFGRAAHGKSRFACSNRRVSVEYIGLRN